MNPRDSLDADLVITKEILALNDTKLQRERLNKAVSASGSCALHVALHAGNVALMKQIISLNADLDVVDKSGKTALHYAAEANNKEFIKLLLDAGASMDIVDKEGLTPFKDDRRMAELHHGPRMKSQATKDLEIILKAFLNNDPVNAKVNRLNEIEIEIGNKVYNLSKILEHKPDFEHLDVIPNDDSIANNLFRRLTTYQIDLDDTVPVDSRANMVIYEVNRHENIKPRKGELLIGRTKDGIICRRYSPDGDIVIPWDKLPLDIPRRANSVDDYLPYLKDIADVITHVDTSGISEAEARAIRFYTMDKNSDKAYEKINRFLRENGKISDLFAADTVDLRTMMFVLAYLPSAIAKLRESNKTEKQELYRGERYDTSRLADTVMDNRTKQTLAPEAGFVSTSRSESVSKIFEANKRDNKNIHILLTQLKNAFGVDVARYSENQMEQEVLVMPGMQTIFRHSPDDKNKLIAMPVRSIDEVYYNNYNSKIMELRTDLIDYINQLENGLGASPVIINQIDHLCQNLYVYESGELVKSHQACADCLKKLSLVNGKDANETKIIHKLIDKVINLQEHISNALDQECGEANVELLRAASYAYSHHLQHRYKDEAICNEDMQKIIKGVKIERPNHGLAHSMRKALYVPVICSAFKAHARDQEFKRYLASLTPERLELIQDAVMFSVTGRESEATATDKETLKVYEGYRKQAKINFMAYVKSRGLYSEDTGGDEIKERQNAFIETLAEQVKYMGNPKFFEGITQGYRQPEKIFLYYILNIAHDLDLMRCYDLDKYEKAINGKIDGLAIQYVDATFKDRAMPVLFQMASDAINATGDRQFIKYKDGRLVAANEDYQPSFADCSKNVNDCFDACMKSNPVFTEVQEGKLNIDLPKPNIRLTKLQEAIITGDSVVIDDVINEPGFKKAELTDLMQSIIDVYQGEPDAWNKMIDILQKQDGFNAGDLAIALYLVIQTGSLDLIKSMLAKGADTLLKNNDGSTVLHTAIDYARSDVVRELIKYTDVNIRNDNGHTPLYLAVANNLWDVVDILLDSPEIDLSGPIASTIIMQAVKNGMPQIALKVLESKQVINIEFKDAHGSPLWHAINYSQIDVATKLLERGAKIYSDSKSNDNCVNLALKYRINAIITLLAKNAAVNVDKDYSVDAIKFRAGTLLHFAIENDNRELFNILMSRNARFDIRSSGYQDETALEFAARTNSKFAMAMLKYAMKRHPPPDAKEKYEYLSMLIKSRDTALINHAIDLLKMNSDDINYVNEGGITALNIAASTGSVEAVEILLKERAELNVAGAHSTLMAAATNNHWGVVRRLLKLPDAVVDPQKITSYLNMINEETFLAQLAMRGDYELFNDVLNDNKFAISQEAMLGMAIAFCKTKNSDRLLAVLASGRITDVNMRDKEGLSLIQHAAENNMWNVVEKLLSVDDIDVTGVNGYGSSLLHLACASTRLDIVEVLLDKDVAVDIEDHQERTALEIAAENGNWGTVETIIDHPDVNLNYQSISTLKLLAAACQDNREDILDEIFDQFPPPPSILLKAVTLAIVEPTLQSCNMLVKYLLDHELGELEKVNNEGKTSMKLAASYHRTDLLQLLEESAAKAAVKLNDHPIIQAAINDDWETVSQSLASSDLKPALLEQVLCHAAKDCYAHEDLMLEILAEMESLNPRASFDGKDEHALLVLVAASGNRVLMEGMLALMPSVDLEHPVMRAAIATAAKNKQWDVVSDMVDVLMPDDTRKRPKGYEEVYREAIIAGNTRAVMMLAHRVIADKVRDAINKRVDKNYFTPLHLAAQYGHQELAGELIRLLSSKGMDVESTAGKENVTPFSVAVANNNWEMANALVNNPLYKISFNTDSNIHALLRLVENKQMDILSSILNNSTNDEYKTLFIIAVKYSNMVDGLHTIIKLLLDHDPKLANLRLAENVYPIHLAVTSDSLKTMQILLENGANAEIHDKNGVPAIYVAMKSKQIEMVKLLLPESVNVMSAMKLSDILTFMNFAAKKGDKALLAMFFDKVCPPDKKFEGNKTLLQVAEANQLHDLLKVLQGKNLSTEKSETMHAQHATMFGSPQQKRPVLSDDEEQVEKTDTKLTKH